MRKLALVLVPMLVLALVCSLVAVTVSLSRAQTPIPTWELDWGLDADPAAVNLWMYPEDAAAVTLADVADTIPDDVSVIWHYSGTAEGWKWFTPGWAQSTLDTLEAGKYYIGIASSACEWEIPQIMPTPTPTLTPTPPEAEFTATPIAGYAPEGVQFTDLSQGNVLTWQWDFDNDGVVDSTLQNPQHIYSNPGNYTVSLTVVGPDGNDTEVKVDYLLFTPCPHFADFIAEPTLMEGRHPIQFTDLSVTDAAMGHVTSWAWDFNSDGRIDSNEQNPTHTYTRNGLYSVTLTVITPECEDTLTRHEYIRITGCGG